MYFINVSCKSFAGHPGLSFFGRFLVGFLVGVWSFFLSFFGRFLVVFWSVFGRFLVGFWSVFGRSSFGF